MELIILQPELGLGDQILFWVFISAGLILGIWGMIAGANQREEERIAQIKYEAEAKIAQEKEDDRQKKEAKDIQQSSLWKADDRLTEILDKTSDIIYICDKCKSSKFRVWDLTETFLKVRCLGCKKVKGYELVDESKGLFKAYEDYKKLDSYSYNSYLPAIVDIYDNSLDFKSNFESFRRIFIEGRKQLEEKKEGEEKRSRRISDEVKDKVWRRDNGTCVDCGSRENLEFHHIIPHSKGGANTYRNIEILCETCNRKRSDKIG